jgi:TRAP-type C4-dicarboxylate transport system substrate-binding protein
VLAAVTLHMATIAPTGSRWEKTLSDEAAAIAKDTKQNLTLQYTFDASDEADTVAKLQSGALDGATLTGAGLALLDPSFAVLELPLMFESPDELDAVAAKSGARCRTISRRTAISSAAPASQDRSVSSPATRCSQRASSCSRRCGPRPATTLHRSSIAGSASHR